MEGLNKIEEALLKRELETISEKLKKIGQELIAVFEPYGTIEGAHADELKEYLRSMVVDASEPYYAGHTTRPHTNEHPNHIPEALKKVILEKICRDFIEKVEEINDITG